MFMKATTPILFSLLLCAGLCAQTAPKAPPVDPSLTPVEEVANLPRVLLIGDSISMGYTIPVRELLKGKANVLRVLENAGDSARGIAKLDAWLGAKKWDAIHFNFGLHDLKYLDETGKYVSPDQGKQVASLTQYEANLRQIVERLKKTDAKLIWASTTPVPEGSLGRVKSDELKYNATALKVMKEFGIEIDDLHAVVTDGPADMQLPKNVHFTKDGYQALARSVVASIEMALSKR
jgi:acyl-CoA thioesterase-1